MEQFASICPCSWFKFPLVVVSFIFISSAVDCLLITGPLHTASVLNGDVTLTCRSTLPSRAELEGVTWTHKSAEDQSRVIYHHMDIVDEYKDRFSVHLTGDGSMNLVIRNVTFLDGGLYTCKDLDDDPMLGERKSAHLSVLSDSLHCFHNMSTEGVISKDLANICSHGPDVSSFTCSVIYGGNVAPTLVWTQDGEQGGGERQESNFISNGSLVTSSLVIQIKKAMDGSRIHCSVAFSQKSMTKMKPMITWTSPPIQILSLTSKEQQQLDADVNPLAASCPIITNMKDCSYDWSNDTTSNEEINIIYYCQTKCKIRNVTCVLAVTTTLQIHSNAVDLADVKREERVKFLLTIILSSALAVIITITAILVVLCFCAKRRASLDAKQSGNAQNENGQRNTHDSKNRITSDSITLNEKFNEKELTTAQHCEKTPLVMKEADLVDSTTCRQEKQCPVLRRSVIDLNIEALSPAIEYEVTSQAELDQSYESKLSAINPVDKNLPYSVDGLQYHTQAIPKLDKGCEIHYKQRQTADNITSHETNELSETIGASVTHKRTEILPLLNCEITGNAVPDIKDDASLNSKQSGRERICSAEEVNDAEGHQEGDQKGHSTLTASITSTATSTTKEKPHINDQVQDEVDAVDLAQKIVHFLHEPSLSPSFCMQPVVANSQEPDKGELLSELKMTNRLQMAQPLSESELDHMDTQESAQAIDISKLSSEEDLEVTGVALFRQKYYVTRVKSNSISVYNNTTPYICIKELTIYGTDSGKYPCDMTASKDFLFLIIDGGQILKKSATSDIIVFLEKLPLLVTTAQHSRFLLLSVLTENEMQKLDLAVVVQGSKTDEIWFLDKSSGKKQRSIYLPSECTKVHHAIQKDPAHFYLCHGEPAVVCLLSLGTDDVAITLRRFLPNIQTGYLTTDDVGHIYITDGEKIEMMDESLTVISINEEVNRQLKQPRKLCGLSDGCLLVGTLDGAFIVRAINGHSLRA